MPRVVGSPARPKWTGGALIVGDNPVAEALDRELSRDGLTVDRINSCGDVESSIAGLPTRWQSSPPHHLFITTAWDEAAVNESLSPQRWGERSGAAWGLPFTVCRGWLAAAIERGVIDQCTAAAMVRGGGNLGVRPHRGDAATAESGSLAGLFKAMMIETWMRGHRDAQIRVLDAAEGVDAGDFVRGALAELACPSHDAEAIVGATQRSVVVPVFQPVDPSAAAREIGGTWLVAGGGRGITAACAIELARRHPITLRMLGTAPPPAIDEATASRASSDLNAVRRQVMAEAKAAGVSPPAAWRDFEKAIEIDQTLRRCGELGIDASYHQVDLSDAAAVERVVGEIRQFGDPIRAVIQGAGSGQDARMDRKRPEKVRQCLAAKIDGTLALAAATAGDPLDWFIGFGSISGRFGANGQTDYSAANDAMAKWIGRLGVTRPATRCVTMLWHAWGDIGMAAKPEAKLALEMIGMRFMPAAEGIGHFINEIERGGDEPEVLITDRSTVRRFAISSQTSAEPAADDDGIRTACPVTDPFLSQHRVAGRPTLPLAVAIHWMTQFALPATSTSLANVEAVAACKWADDRPSDLQVVQNGRRIELRRDLCRSDGRVVDQARVHFCAEILHDRVDQTSFDLSSTFERLPVVYSDNAAGAIYHGPALRCLRTLGLDAAAEVAEGRIITPSPIELLGDARSLAGHRISPAVLDASLYAAGCLIHAVTGHASLPRRIGRLDISRLPRPGEPLAVTVRRAGGDRWEVVVAGINGELIHRLVDYEVGSLVG